MSESISASDKPIRDLPTLECRHPGLLIFAVMLVSIMQFLDVTIANVALPHMQSSLGATMDTISWVLTSYIIAGVMVTPVIGWCTDRLGSRRVFLFAVGGFLLASMLCGASTSLTQMVIFRALQGACAGFLGPMCQTVLFDVSRPSKQATIMSLWGMTVMIAPITGPMLGGLLTETLNWRWVFYVNLPVGIPTLLLLIWLLPARPLADRKLDRFGFLVLAIGLIALQLLLDRGQHKDWFASTEIIIEAAIALSAFWVFFVHTRSAKNPLFPPALFRDANFIGSLGIMVVLGIANVAIAAVLPTMYQKVYGYDAFDTGLLLMPRGLGVMISMMFASRIMYRMDIRLMITAGYLVASSALFTMSGWSSEMGRWAILYPGFIQGLGMGLIFTPMTMAAFSTISAADRPDASSLLNLMRNLGGSFGISAIFTMISRNTQVSHSDLSAHVTSFSVPGFDPASFADRFGDSGAIFMQMIDGEINRQALMIAYINNFYLVAIALLVVAVFPLFLKPIRLSLSQAGG